jgi:hypothetical protein
VTERVSTLLNVTSGGGRYIFLLIEWNEFADRVRDELNRQADAFGLALGSDGVFVQPYSQRMDEAGAQLRTKPWPAEIAERFETDQDPIILVLDRDWQSFDPREHGYAIIWISGFQGDPAAVRPLLQQLAMRTRRGDDIIGYLREVAEKEERAAKVERRGSALSRIASYVEIKPQVFGVAVDVTAILRDIFARR